MSGINTDNLRKRDGSAQVPMDTVIQGSAKAWANLNGTGTITLNDGFNVSSVTDNGVGDYSYAFSTARPSSSYSVSKTSISANLCVETANNVSFLTSSIRPGIIGTWNGSISSNAVTTDGTQLIAIHGDPVP